MAVALIDELLAEAKRYVKAVRTLLDAQPGEPPASRSYIRNCLCDVHTAMVSTIVPLCVAAELIAGSCAGGRFRESYEVLEAELKQGVRCALRHRAVHACRKVFDDFEHGVKSWCNDYESWLRGDDGLRDGPASIWL